MGDSKRMVKRKVALWDKQRGLCFWCGRQTVLTVGLSAQRAARIATIDHLRCKYLQNRREPTDDPHEERTVMACYECNHTRGALVEAAVPIDERRRRSGRYSADESYKIGISMKPSYDLKK